MYVAGSEFCCEAVAVTGEGEQRMKAAFSEMTVERHLLLITVGRVLSGINVHYEPTLLLSPYQWII